MDDASIGVEMRRSVRPGLLEVDLDGGVLIINYSMTARVVDNGEVIEDTKELRKRIKLGAISSSTDIEELADRIIESQKLLTDAKFDRVCELLLELQQHKAGRQRNKSKKKHKKKHKSSRSNKHRGKSQPKASAAPPPAEAKAEHAEPEIKADIELLDEYTMAMYEGMQKKLEAAKCLRQLARDPSNLDAMYEDVTLQNVLARELKENFQKSTDLNIILCQIYAEFAQFVQMQELLLRKNIGSLVLQIARMEINRYNKRTDAMNSYKKRAEKSKEGMAAFTNFREKFMLWVREHEKLCQICFKVLLNLADDRRTESKMVAKDIVKMLVSVVIREKVRNPHLLVVCLDFLKRLSIVQENKDLMLRSDMSLAILRYTQFGSGNQLQQTICMKVLQLLFNLSFSVIQREKLADTDLAEKLVNMLEIKKFRGISLQLLYHLSMARNPTSSVIKALSTQKAVVLVLELVLCFPRPKLPTELAGLAVNMTHSPVVAAKMASAHDEQGLGLLMKRLLQYKDELLFKVIRNIASWTYHVQEELANDEDYDQMGMWATFAPQLVELTASGALKDTAVLVEGLGTLALLTPDDLEEDVTWYELMKDHKLLEIVEQLMQTTPRNNLDVLFLCLTFVANLALDQYIGEAMANTSIPLQCVKILETTKDNGLSLQAMFTIYRIARLPEVQNVLLFDSEDFYGDDDGAKHLSKHSSHARKAHHNPLHLINIICAALTDSNLATVKMANELLDLFTQCDLLDGDGSISTAIKSARFELFNKAWVGVVRDEDSSVATYEEEGTLIVDGEEEDSMEDAYQDYMYGDPDVAAAYDLDMDIMDASMDGAELGDSMDPAI